jgi:hypothetical protein
MGCLLDALSRACDVLGLDRAAAGDAVFAGLVLARMIEPVSKRDSLRVLEEAGVAPVSYATLKRRLPAHAKVSWRQKISAACAAHAGLGQASLVSSDVSTLYSEADEGRRVASRVTRRSGDWTRKSPSACSAEGLVQTPLRPHLWCYGARR